MAGKPRYAKRNYKKRNYKKRNYKTKNKGNPKVKYPVAPPAKAKICLKYADMNVQSMTPSVNFIQNIFRPNCTFDPEFTTLGHQSLFRDQMFAMYSFVRCVAFRMSVLLTTDSFTPVECLLYINDTSTPSSHSVAREYRGTRRVFVVTGKPVRVSLGGLVDRFLQNRKYTALTDNEFKQNDTSPLGATQTVWVGLSYYYPGATSVNVFAQWSIKQYCQFSEVKQVGLS